MERATIFPEKPRWFSTSKTSDRLKKIHTKPTHPVVWKVYWCKHVPCIDEKGMYSQMHKNRIVIKFLQGFES